MDVLFPNLHDWSPQAMGIASEWIFERTLPLHQQLQDLICYLLLFLQAVLITRMVRRYRIIPDDILFPAAFYLLVASAIPAFLDLSPQMIANTFLIIALDQLMQSYRNNSAAHNIFNVGFWISIASLFYFSYLSFLLISLFGLPFIRRFSLREILMILIGAIVPYFLIGAYYFWIDALPYFLEQHIYTNLGVLDFKDTAALNTYVALGIMGFMLLIVLSQYARLMLRKNIQFQKQVGIFYFVLLVSIGSLFMQSNVDLGHLMILSLPLGISLGFIVRDLPRLGGEALHLVLLILILLWQAFPFWSSNG